MMIESTLMLLAGNPFMAVAQPIINLIQMAAGPVIAVVGALGVIYCVFLGAKLAKAEEPHDREKAKNSLKNAIIGFILIFVLILALMIGLPAMTQWLNSSAGVTIDTGAFGK